jgi:hypothetical protein
VQGLRGAREPHLATEGIEARVRLTLLPGRAAAPAWGDWLATCRPVLAAGPDIDGLRLRWPTATAAWVSGMPTTSGTGTATGCCLACTGRCASNTVPGPGDWL